MDAYLIAEAHQAEQGVCRCGRPLPCIAAERAHAIMDETMRSQRETAAAEAAARAFSEAPTQELPIIRIESDGAGPAPAAVGARFPRQRDRADEEPDWVTGAPTPQPEPVPEAQAEPAPAPVGARFYRERRGSRHRA